MGITKMNRIMLEQTIDDYLLWMISGGYAQGTWKRHEVTLRRFLDYVDRKAIPDEAGPAGETLTKTNPCDEKVAVFVNGSPPGSGR